MAALMAKKSLHVLSPPLLLRSVILTRLIPLLFYLFSGHPLQINAISLPPNLKVMRRLFSGGRGENAQ
jgi:hypothetical protein